jgi:uncharacterized membrane protein YqaE (UPF0057 family)
MALTGTAKTIVDILLVIFLPPLAVFLVSGTSHVGGLVSAPPPYKRVR